MILASFLSKGLQTLLSSSFGSDEFTPYSAEYSWLANQMAHAMMGFFLAALWAWVGRRWFWPFLLAPAKIPFDYLFAIGLTGGHFRPPAWEFWADKLTDTYYWSFGMAIATAVFSPNPFWATRRRWAIPIVVVVGSLVSVLIGQWWVRQKDAFDSSEIPNTYVRLCNFESRRGSVVGFDTDDPAYGNAYDTLDAYVGSIETGSPRMHLIIIGGDVTDRTTLALALGCEHTARIQLVYYTTLTKGMEDPTRVDRFLERVGKPKAQAGCPLRCVIIDDVDTTRPPLALTEAESASRIEEGRRVSAQSGFDFAQPQQRHVSEQGQVEAAVKTQLDQLKTGHVNSIWVLGGDPGNPEHARRITAWIGAITARLGTDAGPVKVVKLRPADRFRAE
jgi:hypothetical protein